MDEVDSIGRKNKARGIWKTGCGWVIERCGQEDPAGAKQAAEKLRSEQESNTSGAKAQRILNHLRHG